MNKKQGILFGKIVVIVIAVVAGFGIKDIHKGSGHMDHSSKNMKMDSSKNNDMSGMKMDETLPDNLEKAQNPKFKEGEKVMLMADHMKGMKNAKGTIAAAYNTPLYEVNYTPTNGGKMVMGHKWLSKDDFQDGMDHQKGDEVTLKSKHMAGMDGAKATITAVNQGPAYVVNYTPTNGGEMVMNHKYLVESELMAR